MGWLPGYRYRVKIPVNATAAGAQTNFQMSLNIVKGTGTNVAGTIYLNNRSKNWPDDIRFTGSNGITLLTFWREESDATDGVWWVKVPSIPASGKVNVYLYYGKSGGSDTSDGYDTMNYFLHGNDSLVSRYSGNPVLIEGAAGSPDLGGLRDPSNIVKSGSTYYIAYNSWSTTNATNVATISMASSTDLQTWTKMGIAINVGAGWESKWVQDPYIYYNSSDGLYYMFYAGGTTADVDGVPTLPAKIGVATNPDISNVNGWTKYASNPILDYNSQPPFDALGVVSQSIIKVGSTYYMFYSNQGVGLRGISYATSTNLLSWTKYSGNPILGGSEHELPMIWYDSNDAMYYILVNIVNEAYGTTEAQALYYSSSVDSGWSTENRRILFMRFGSGWDGAIIGGAGILTDSTGKLTNIVYDGKSTTAGNMFYNHQIGVATIDWSFKKLWNWTTQPTAARFNYTDTPGKLKILGTLSDAHDRTTWFKLPFDNGNYIIVTKMNGTWNTNYYKSGITIGNGVANGAGGASTQKKIYSEIMHESSAAPHLCAWQEYWDAARTVYVPIQRYAEPAFPADLWIKLTKNGDIYSTQYSTDGVTFSGAATQTKAFGNLSYIGMSANNDDNINTFSALFEQFFARKFTSPEPTWATPSTGESIDKLGRAKRKTIGSSIFGSFECGIGRKK